MFEFQAHPNAVATPAMLSSNYQFAQLTHSSVCGLVSVCCGMHALVLPVSVVICIGVGCVWCCGLVLALMSPLVSNF